MAEHISSHFNQELENVRSEVMRMGGLVEARLQQVLAALDEGSSSGLTEVIDGDADINKLEVEIDDACQTIIARRQPAAGDLRFVLAVSRVIVDLERIGDEVKKIALKAHELLGNNRVAAPELYNTHRMGTVTLGMIHRALDAFARLDTGAVIELSETDKHLDADYRAQLRSLITFMMEDPRSITRVLNIMWSLRALERIGDHARNLAQYVVYLVDGEDVRHVDLDK